MARYEPFWRFENEPCSISVGCIKISGRRLVYLLHRIVGNVITFFPSPPRRISRVSFNKRDFSSEREETRDITPGHLTCFSLKADVTRWKSLQFYSPTQWQHSDKITSYLCKCETDRTGQIGFVRFSYSRKKSREKKQSRLITLL